MAASTGEQSGKRSRSAKALPAQAKETKVVEIKLDRGASKGKRKAVEEKRTLGRKAKPVEEKQLPPSVVPSQEDSEVMIRSFQKSMAAKSKKQPKPVKVSYAQFLAKPPTSGKKYSIDLRIHTPGTVGYFASGGVSPTAALVRLARVKGLDIVGLTDYFNASYIDLVQNSPDRGAMSILPGFDICCAVAGCRDVHFTCLFPESSNSDTLFRILQELGVPREQYGRSDYCLGRALEEIIAIVESYGGALIPTQVDKTPYRQLAIPTLVEKFGMHVFDLVHPENLEFFRERWPSGQFTFLSFSNSSALAQIGTRSSKVKLSSPDFKGIKELIQRRGLGDSEVVAEG